MPNDSLRIASHLGIGVVCVAASALLAGAALLVPGPGVPSAAPSHTVRPAPSPQLVVCPGPPVTLGATGKADSVTTLGAPDLAAPSSGSRPVTRRFLRGVTGGRAAGGSPVVFTAAAPSAKTAGSEAGGPFAAAQSRTVNHDGIAGLAASGCTEPATDSWIVAGATTLGQTSLLLLANPSAATVTVTLDVWGLNGPVTSGADTLTVSAGSQKVVPLAGIAPNKAALALKVHATGAGVAALVQQSFVQGLTPRGVALAGPSARPARHQVIPGLTIRDLAAVQAGEGSDDAGVDLPAVRLANPGTHTARVTIGAVGEAGTKAGNTYTATLEPGRVTEVPLAGLTDGDYTVTLTSTAAVVAAARTTVEASGHASGVVRPQDFAWFVAALPLPGAPALAVAAGPAPRLHVANPGATPSAVTLTAGTKTTTMTVPAGGSASVPLAAGVYAASGLDGDYASVGYAGRGEVASYPVAPPAAPALPLRVYTQ